MYDWRTRRHSRQKQRDSMTRPRRHPQGEKQDAPAVAGTYLLWICVVSVPLCLTSSQPICCKHSRSTGVQTRIGYWRALLTLLSDVGQDPVCARARCHEFQGSLWLRAILRMWSILRCVQILATPFAGLVKILCPFRTSCLHCKRKHWSYMNVKSDKWDHLWK